MTHSKIQANQANHGRPAALVARNTDSLYINAICHVPHTHTIAVVKNSQSKSKLSGLGPGLSHLTITLV